MRARGVLLPRCCHDVMLAAPADVAQLVEQRFRKPQVTGSNPVVGSSLYSRQSAERNCHAVAPTGRIVRSQVIFVASYGLAATPLRIVGVRRWNVDGCDRRLLAKTFGVRLPKAG